MDMAKIFDGLHIAGMDKVINVFKNNPKSNSASLPIENSRAINVGKFQKSIISICASLTENSFGMLESTLVVRLKNEGKADIKNFKLVANVSTGGVFIQPGEIFGVASLSESNKLLAPGQSITYKVSLRSTGENLDNSIEIYLSHAKNSEDLITARLPLIRKAISKKSA